MLTGLNIRNVVLIDKLDIDFSKGLSVLTGETGAGKSILLDSLGLALGNRADTGLIRQGTDKLSVTANFVLQHQDKNLQKLLLEADLEPSLTISIKRSLSTGGVSKIFYNDEPISLKTLKEIGKYLVEVHGQFDNQGLLNSATHLSVLDSFAGTTEEQKAVAESFGKYKNISEQRVDAEKLLASAKAEEEELSFWAKELEDMHLRENEEEELKQKRLELQNAEKILESLSFAYNSLNTEQDVVSAIVKAMSALDKANALTQDKYKEISDGLERSLTDLRDVVAKIEEVSSESNLDENSLDSIEERYFALKALARKHGVGIADLPVKLQEFKQKLQSLEFGEENINHLRSEEAKAKQQYIEAAQNLSNQRIAAAKKLDVAVLKELAPLKMEKAKFETAIERKQEAEWSEDGFDKVCFTVSTNPNSPQGPISKIASGGELARFMLALKVNLANNSAVETMIFDEVDTGIGGATSQAVGERLKRLADKVQILVVTHSPQVAAEGNCHFKVEKKTKDNITTTYIKELTNVERIDEIARMLSGKNITSEAKAAAESLLMSA